MVEPKSPEQRKQEREKSLVGRDKASRETVQYLNQLRKQPSDPAVAEAVALLHAQVNGDHPEYTRPPKEEPFGHWHKAIEIDTPNVTTHTDTTAEADVTLSTFEFYDSDARVKIQFREVTDGLDTQLIETAEKTTSTTGTLTFSTDKLTAGTQYRVRGVVEADHETGTDVEYGEYTTFTTDE